MADYQGKVLVFVNTASQCGFTPQFKELQELYGKYRGQGLEILGFPCNQFAGQEPGTNEEVQQFCRFNYGVTFPIFAKGDVRGENAQPLFRYLTREKGFQGFDPEHPLAEILTNALKESIWKAIPSNGISPNSWWTGTDGPWSGSSPPHPWNGWKRPSRNVCRHDLQE